MPTWTGPALTYLDGKIVRLLGVVHLDKGVDAILVEGRAASCLDFSCADCCDRRTHQGSRIFPHDLLTSRHADGRSRLQTRRRNALLDSPGERGGAPAAAPCRALRRRGFARKRRGESSSRRARCDVAPNAGCDVVEIATAPPITQNEPLAMCIAIRAISGKCLPVCRRSLLLLIKNLPTNFRATD